MGPNLNLPNGLPTATQLDIDLSAYKMIRIVGTPYAGSTTNNTGHNNVLYLDLTHPPLGGYYKGGITIPYFSGGNGWDTTLVAEGKGFCFMALVNSTKSAFKYRVSLDKTVYTANDPSKVFQIWGIR